jgi:hypothetical protein
VCGTDSTVNSGLVGVQIGTAVLVRVSVSVWIRQYGKEWAGGRADCYSVFGEGWCECVELTVR